MTVSCINGKKILKCKYMSYNRMTIMSRTVTFQPHETLVPFIRGAGKSRAIPKSK